MQFLCFTKRSVPLFFFYNEFDSLTQCTPFSNLPTHSWLKVTAFWNTMLCSMVYSYQSDLDLKTWRQVVYMKCQNAGIYLPNYKAAQLRQCKCEILTHHTHICLQRCIIATSFVNSSNLECQQQAYGSGLVGCDAVLLGDERLPQFQESTHVLAQCPTRPESSVTPL